MLTKCWLCLSYVTSGNKIRGKCWFGLRNADIRAETLAVLEKKNIKVIKPTCILTDSFNQAVLSDDFCCSSEVFRTRPTELQLTGCQLDF